MEEQEFFSASKKCVVNEARTRLFEKLKARRIGLKEIEEKVSEEARKFKGGKKFNSTSRRKIVKLYMGEKARDNLREGVHLRKGRIKARKVI